MSSDHTRRSRAAGGVPVPPRRSGRRRRLLAGVAFVFAAGIGLGALLGSWLAKTELPSAQVALESREAPYEVTTRAYRPPVRNFGPVAGGQSEPETDPLKRPAASDIVAEVESRSTQATKARPIAQPDPEPETRKGEPRQTAALPPVRRRGTPQWLANAVPSPAINGRPMIAIVIDDLGLSQKRARRTIALPGPITLAFLPYGHNLRKLTKEGRAAGHELIIHMNMEPKDHDVDPGPKALLTSLDPSEIHNRLLWAFQQFDGYIGISNHMGSRFTEWPDGMEVVVKALKRRGLLYFDSVTSTKSVGPALARAHGAAYASRDVFLDHDRNAKAVVRQLAQTERVARRRGYAIAIGHPHDVTIDALQKWLPDVVARGFVIVPLSAIVRRRLGEG
ncbi:MAG: divergent polysaccharide deacetylase family protein [Rhodospirillaceae bacterium]|nr:divergent polysaccharide deacetylase family protein [Rhodospirillaceae bacterium]